MLWLAKMKALTADFAHGDTCVWCEVPRDKLGSLEKFPLRTPSRERAAAHLPPLINGIPQFPFSSPVCGLTFKAEKNWEREARIMTDEAKQKAYKKSHRGYVWRRQRLGADVFHTIMCILHMRLS